MILDGKKIRDQRIAALASRTAGLKDRPSLAVIQVGDRADSNTYIGAKEKWAAEAGITVERCRFAEDAGEAEVRAKIEELNRDAGTHGIIVQIPLPKHLDKDALIDVIDPVKDVDGLAALNVKRRVTASSKPYYMPATAKGILSLLDAYNVPIEGKRAIVLGRSALVGRPVADALLSRNATVTVAHSRSEGLGELMKENDIVVVCIGKPRFVGRGLIAPGQFIIDVGTSADPAGEQTGDAPGAGRLAGDVDFDEVKDLAAAISPVPGGVGPMTVASILENTLEAYNRQAAEL